MENPQQRPLLSEDWTATLLGLLLLLMAVLGWTLPSASLQWNNLPELRERIFSGKQLQLLFQQFILLYIVAVLASWLTGKGIKNMLRVFPLLYLLSLFALLLAGNAAVRSLNLEAVIMSLGIGLLLSNLFRLPAWITQTLSTELFVKIGLVLLGSSVIFSDILKAGSLGILQSLFVVLSVWYFAYWLCRRLRVDEEMSMMVSSAVSICGVSAAIATAGAIKGDTKKLSYVISLVLITAIPMMIGMPYLAKWMGLSQAVTGAWLGGSIDTTGAVVASGTLVGEEALKISTIVKFSQNVLLGIAAFAISIYWTLHGKSKQEEQATGWKVIWERFPKFVLGFLAASLLFSFVVPADTIAASKGFLKNLQNLWFVLAFTSIGLETRFADLFHQDNRRPLYAFLGAQTFNIIVTLLIAYILFR